MSEPQPVGAKQSGRTPTSHHRPQIDEGLIGGVVAAMIVLLVWLHVLAAVTWIGGTIFLSLVLAPLVRSHKAAPEFMALFRLAARRFRVVVWSAIALLLTTGPVLLHQRGLSVLAPIGWPQVLRIKLGLVAVLLLLTVAHDLLLGPAVRRISAISVSARTRWEQTLIRLASWVPRVGVLLALAVIFAAVVLTRL